jgi:hypothetical protein
MIAFCGRERGMAERKSAAIILSAKREGSEAKQFWQ